MKTLVLALLAAAALAGRAGAYSTVSQPELVSVSSFAYTNVTGAQHRVAKRYTLKVKNPTAQTVSLHGHIGPCAGDFSISTHTVRGPYVLAPSDLALSLELGQDECLYLVGQGVNFSTGVVVQAVAPAR